MENVRIRTTNANRFGKTIVTSFGSVEFDCNGIAFIDSDNVAAAKEITGIVISPEVPISPPPEKEDNGANSLTNDDVLAGLDDMTIAELRGLASQHSITIPTGISKKADIIGIIFNVLTK